jgi:VPDSG-CTERM motif
MLNRLKAVENASKRHHSKQLPSKPMRKTNKSVLAAMVAASLTTIGAQANTVTGNLYKVPESVVNSSTGANPSNVPGGTPDVTFDVTAPGINFNSGASVQSFLNSGGAFNIVENTAGTLASAMDNFITGTIIDFKGLVTVTTGQTFTVTQDDGLYLSIGGNVLAGIFAGPTAPITKTLTYSGPSGTFPFEMVYTECCAGSAVLQISLPFSSGPSVPEGGSTLALLGGALALLGTVSRRMRK